jgi:tetratricopeptide (TPR) repeat protein
MRLLTLRISFDAPIPTHVPKLLDIFLPSPRTNNRHPSYGHGDAVRAIPFPFAATLFGICLLFAPESFHAQANDDPLVSAIEIARRARDPSQLQSLSSQLEQRIKQNPSDFEALYQLPRVQAYLADAYHMNKDKKSASAAIDKAIDAAQRSIQLNEKSAPAHSLLADLYGRKISFGGMFAGARLGPKITEENKRALALDDKDARVWASLGRQYLMAPKMFGGDVNKSIQTFQKSLSLDPQQDETYVWLAKAYEKLGDTAKAREAVQRALRLNPQNPMAQDLSSSLK